MFYSIRIFFELKSEVSFGTSKFRHFVKIQKQTPHCLLQRDVIKQSELIRKPGLNPNHCSIRMEKAFYLQIFAQQQTFDREFAFQLFII